MDLAVSWVVEFDMIFVCGPKPIGLSVNFENVFFFVWVAEIDLISVRRIELDLISVKGWHWFGCSVRS